MGETTEFPVTVGECLARAVAQHPAGEALVTRSGRYTYAELDHVAGRARDALWALGVRPGDRVAAALPNDTDVVASFHGAMRLGAVWLGVNRNLAAPEKEYLLDDSDASLLLCDAETAAQLGTRRSATRRAVVGETGEWSDALASADPVELADVDPFAPAALAYTSGTTGHPKGAVHSQYNLLLPGASLVASRSYDSSLRKGDCYPLTVLNLQVLTTLLVAQVGGCAVIMDRMDADGVAEWIRQERVTTWNGPPALIHSLASGAIDPADLASLDEVWTGGGDCPEALRERFSARFGMPVLATYGLSEAPTVVTIDSRDGDHRDGGSGRPLPHLAVEIRGEQGAALGVGETGEICVGAVTEGPWAGAYRTMLGYLGREEATASSLAGGVLHTGDIGFLDADGFLHVRERKSLVIIRGGANVYPAEVERVLGEAPGVAGCVVFGVPDERLGERVVAAIEVTEASVPDLAAIESFCREALARYKVPERFVVLPALPRNAMGKVVRSGLAQLVS